MKNLWLLLILMFSLSAVIAFADDSEEESVPTTGIVSEDMEDEDSKPVDTSSLPAEEDSDSDM